MSDIFHTRDSNNNTTKSTTQIQTLQINSIFAVTLLLVSLPLEDNQERIARLVIEYLQSSANNIMPTTTHNMNS